VVETVSGSPGDLVIFAADDRAVAQGVLGGMRLELADRYDLRSDIHDVHWVVDFPMFERNAEGAWTSLHHPFTAPTGDLDGDPGALRSRGYDLVMDGTELGGGSIRIHTAEVQEKVLGLLGMDPTRRRRGSGSCSTRSSTGRRRTEASRSASTASSRSCPAASRSATSSRSRRRRAGRTR
jgi:aspartyl-tRNA synthetase